MIEMDLNQLLRCGLGSFVNFKNSKVFFNDIVDFSWQHGMDTFTIISVKKDTKQKKTSVKWAYLIIISNN
jgi:hypothetical protein